MPNHSWESPRAKRAHMAATQRGGEPAHAQCHISNPRQTPLDQSDASARIHGPTCSSYTDLPEAIPHAKDRGTHVSTTGRRLKAVGSWARSADPLVGRQPSGPHRLKLRRGASSLVENVGSGSISCSTATQDPWLPPIYMRGVGKK